MRKVRRGLIGIVALAAGVTLPLGGIVPASAVPDQPGTVTDNSSGVGYTDKTERKEAAKALVQAGKMRVEDESAPSGSGQTYYVDSQAGDDDATGTSPGAAWKTFKKINGKEFEPGDRILLKAGSVWEADGTEVAKERYDYTTWVGNVGTDVEGGDPVALLAPRGSGTEKAPIVLSSYGTGDAPKLVAKGVVNDAVQLHNSAFWDISNLDISNFSEGLDPTRFQVISNNGQVPGTENPLTGDHRGIHIEGENAGDLKGIRVHNNFVHDVSGYTWSVSSAGVDRSKRTGGIVFEGLKGDATTPSQFVDVEVYDNTIANTAFANLVFKQFSGMGTARYTDKDPGWGDRTVGKANAQGVVTEDPDWRPHTGIRVYGNYLSNRETQYGWDSMYLTSIKETTVEDNIIDGAGVSGIEMYYSDDVVVQNNEVSEMQRRTGAADTNGIDPDRASTNVLIQYNYLYDSGEGILLCGFGFGSAIVRFNVVENIERNYINPHGGPGVNVIYNNLMYNTRDPQSANAGNVRYFASSGSASEYLRDSNPHYLLNNIFFNSSTRATGSVFQDNSIGSGVTYDSNVYYGPGVVASSTERLAITSDPKLLGDVTQAIANAAIGDASSPVIAAGAEVDLADIVPGFHVQGASATDQLPVDGDFFGTSMKEPMNVGVAAYIPPAGKGHVSGFITDDSGEALPGGTVAINDDLSVTADASGRYFVEAEAGTYELVPSAEGHASGKPVEVKLVDGKTSRIDLVVGDSLTTEGTISGKVTSSRQPISEVAVVVTKAGQVVDEAETDSDGSYTIAGVEKGEGYVVTASKEGYEQVITKDVTVTANRVTTVDFVLSRSSVPYLLLIDEDFNDESTGDFTETDSGVLVATDTNRRGAITIDKDPNEADNKYLRINKTSASSGTVGVYNPKKVDATERVTIEARVMRTNDGNNANQLGMYSYNESTWRASDPAASQNPSATFAFSRGNIITHNVTGQSTTKTAGSYQLDKWYTIRNVANLAAGTFDLYIDDMDTPVLSDQPLRSVVDDLNHFLFFINGSNTGDLCVDYFKVSVGDDTKDDSLESIEVTANDRTVALTESSDGLSYTGDVDPHATNATVAVTPTNPNASIAINGEEAKAGVGITVPLSTGDDSDDAFRTEVPVVVGDTEYSVVLNQINPNQMAWLKTLEIEGFEFTPTFNRELHGADNLYVVENKVPSSVDAVTVKWNRGFAGQSVQVNGGEGITEDSTTVNLSGGDNTISVTSGSATGEFVTYMIKVTRDDDGTEPIISASTASRCVAGKVVLTVSVSNLSDDAKDIVIESPYGSKTVTGLAGGKTSSAAFSSRLAAIPSGQVQVTPNTDGEDSPVKVDFDGSTCK